MGGGKPSQYHELWNNFKRYSISVIEYQKEKKEQVEEQAEALST